MARKYSGSKGIAGSKKPANMNPSWISYKPKEIEMMIVKLAKAGDSPSQIGIKLRDNYGIPSVRATAEKKITEILKEKNLLKKLPEDLSSLIKRAVQIRKHIERSKKDMTAVRGMMITESKIKKLAKYYISKKKLPADWRYDRATAEMLVD